VKAEIISTNGRPRLRIQLPLSRPAPAPVPNIGQRGTRRRELQAFEFGNIRIPYGKYKSKGIEYWMLFYRDGSIRRRESRVNFAKLKLRAQEIAIDMANGKTAMSQFTEDQRAHYRHLCKMAGEAGAAPELLIAEAVEARKKAAASKHLRKNLPEVVTEFLALKEKELKRKKWFKFLSLMLNRLATYYAGPIDELKASELNAWLRSISGGLIYRRHHHNAAAQLCRYAQGNNYLPREWDEFVNVDDPDPGKVIIKTWAPEQIVKLLADTHENMIPFTVLQVFAGIRHEEIRPDEFDLAKTPLDWSHFDWDAKTDRYPRGRLQDRTRPPGADE
jgi:hypothetical protein